MKALGWACVIVGLMWVMVFIMYAAGIGHPKEAAEVLGSITGVFAFICCLVALGSGGDDE